MKQLPFLRCDCPSCHYRQIAREQQESVPNSPEQRAARALQRRLSPEEWRRYREEGYFLVTAPSGRQYAVNEYYHSNVFALNEPGPSRYRCYCAVPQGNLPAADRHLAQYLWLMADEDGFRKQAVQMPV